MKVLLVPPTFKYAVEYPSFLSLSDFPAGFAYLASSLKKAGHEVIGFSPNNIVGYVNAETMLKTELTKKIKEVNPDLIGLGGLCTDYKFLKDAIGIIREATKSPIVLGGQIATNDPDVFGLLKPDYMVLGEGEQEIIDIVNGIASQGIIERRKDLQDINAIAFPDYDAFGGKDLMDNYGMATRLLYRYSRTNPRLYPIVTARGCPFACSFCIDHHRGYRARSIENIMAEIKEAYDKYHFNILLILDELFAVNKQRMRDFCVAVLQGKLQYGWDFDWQFQTHASANLDYDHLCLAKEAGCVSFSYGLESASPVVLKSMNKKITPEQVAEAIDLSKQAKIGFSANLIFGDPAETMETIAESLTFWLEHGKESCVFLASLAPYPGSAVFEACRQKGMFLDKREFYENIDKQPFNLTTINTNDYNGFLQLIRYLEQAWLFVKIAPVKKIEALDLDSALLKYQGGRYHKITATCPHCNSEIEYLERLVGNVVYLGTNCTKCHRKIKVTNQ